MSQALARMMAEDVTLKAVNDSENRQSLLYGMGDQHLEITASKLAARYKVEITLSTPESCFPRGRSGRIPMWIQNIRSSPAVMASMVMSR